MEGVDGMEDIYPQVAIQMPWYNNQASRSFESTWSDPRSTSFLRDAGSVAEQKVWNMNWRWTLANLENDDRRERRHPHVSSRPSSVCTSSAECVN